MALTLRSKTILEFRFYPAILGDRRSTRHGSHRKLVIYLQLKNEVSIFSADDIDAPPAPWLAGIPLHAPPLTLGKFELA